MLGLASPIPDATEPLDLWVMPLSVHFTNPGIREVSGQKQEQSIMNTALAERTKQRVFSYFLKAYRTTIKYKAA